MMVVKEASVTQWGTSLGIRLPKEFTDIAGLKHKSMVQMTLKDGVLHVMPAKPPHVRKTLAEILAAALEDGTWDGTPAEITQEDRELLDMPSVGAEVIPYD